ncbi:MAG: hypothetical protein HY052_03750 [Proteobacteria bacterium]|nr:hypothetical protein [Pseudomonadota bacterium]
MQWVILLIFVIGWVLLKVLRGIFEYSSKLKEEQSLKKEIKEKYPNRVINKKLSLFERNKDIIDAHLKSISVSSSHRSYYIDNHTRDCINDICLAESENNIRPDHAYLSYWKQAALSG